MLRRYYLHLAVMFLLLHPFFVYAGEDPSVQEKTDAATGAVMQQQTASSADDEEAAASGKGPLSPSSDFAAVSSPSKRILPGSAPTRPTPVSPEKGEEAGEITEEKGIADPLEPFNRLVFTFNDKLYFWVAKPVARGYAAIVPEWGRVRVRNMFNNIIMPVRFVNNLLQLKIYNAGEELLRFVLNTTAGVAGMFDVAKNINLREHDEDLGLTLGVYGVGNGFYLVLPVLGPSSLRDTVGRVGDYFLDPVNYITPTESSIGVHIFDYTNETSLRIGDYEDLKEAALDPYVSFRNAYFQHRESRIKK